MQLLIIKPHNSSTAYWDHGDYWFLVPKYPQNQLNIYFMTSRVGIAKLKNVFRSSLTHSKQLLQNLKNFLFSQILYWLTDYLVCLLMPSDKHNSITAKATGLIFGLLNVVSSRDVPFANRSRGGGGNQPCKCGLEWTISPMLTLIVTWWCLAYRLGAVLLQKVWRPVAFSSGALSEAETCCTQIKHLLKFGWPP